MSEAKVEKRGRGRPRKPKVEWRDMEVVMASEDLSKKFESTIEHGLDILERMRQLREEMKSVLETVSQDPIRVNPKVFKSVLKSRNAENQEEAAKLHDQISVGIIMGVRNSVIDPLADVEEVVPNDALDEF